LTVTVPDDEIATLAADECRRADRAAYRAFLDIDDVTWARARAWALAVGISGLAEYWISFPSFAAENLHRLHAVAGDAH